MIYERKFNFSVGTRFILLKWITIAEKKIYINLHTSFFWIRNNNHNYDDYLKNSTVKVNQSAVRVSDVQIGKDLYAMGIFVLLSLFHSKFLYASIRIYLKYCR